MLKTIIRKSNKKLIRCFSHDSLTKQVEDGVRKLRFHEDFQLQPAQLDWQYILDRANTIEIQENVNKRKGIGDILQVHDLHKKYTEFVTSLQQKNENIQDYELTSKMMLENLYRKAIELPNKSHPDAPIGDESNAKCVKKIGQLIDDDKRQSVDQIGKKFNWFHDDLGLYSTNRANLLRNDLAKLENALTNYTIKYLLSNGFTFVSVPDILHHSIIEACGFAVSGTRSQVYKLDYLNDYGKYCLSGTSEMALGGLLMNRDFQVNELPLKLCAVSRCFRAEVSGSEREGKLYRLHEFTKVEMFVVCAGDTNASDKMHETLLNYELELFGNLEFHFRVLDMPTHELGSPAYRKYDIEAWMAANKFYGEISSTSNCTDYQSRRLNIKYVDTNGNRRFVHTLNGTACAVPRLLTCIIESNWDSEKNLVKIPNVLRSYFNDREYFEKPRVPRPINHRKNTSQS